MRLVTVQPDTIPGLLDPISPELALVDPELACAARALLPESSAALVRPGPRRLAPAVPAETVALPPAPERTRRSWTVVAVALVVAATPLWLTLAREVAHPTGPYFEQPTQTVPAARR